MNLSRNNIVSTIWYQSIQQSSINSIDGGSISVCEVLLCNDSQALIEYLQNIPSKLKIIKTATGTTPGSAFESWNELDISIDATDQINTTKVLSDGKYMRMYLSIPSKNILDLKNLPITYRIIKWQELIDLCAMDLYPYEPSNTDSDTATIISRWFESKLWDMFSSFFHRFWSIFISKWNSTISMEVMNILPKRIEKNNGSISVNWRSIGIIQIYGIPQYEFDILKFFMNIIFEWESIILRFASEETLYEGEKVKNERTALEKVFDNAQVIESTEEIVYMELLISLNATNEQILSNEIFEFQWNIWWDFDARRVVWIPSRIFKSTILWTTDSSTKLHRWWRKSFIHSHISF